MNIEDFRIYCLSKKGVTESFPFGEDTLVFKVMNKMFAATNIAWEEFSVNLKCNPEKALELREKYSSIQPGFHMNKKHWNTIAFNDGSLSNAFLKEMIDESYDLVVKSMPKKMRESLTE
jgi:predicted DNA-binding protein (MmcQ/YjbR family)